MARILITGGAGFIGSHTADALAAAGHSVRVLDILDPQIHGPDAQFPPMHESVECVRGDVRDSGDVTKALAGADSVCHFAALTGVGQSMYETHRYFDTNCVGTSNVIDCVVRSGISLRRFVLSSSRAVYGEGTHLCPQCGVVYPDTREPEDLQRGQFDVKCPLCRGAVVAVATREDRPSKPVSVYGRTKKAQEEIAAQAAIEHRLPVVCLRYFNVYGSRQSLRNPYTGIVSVFFSRLQSGKPISLYEHGSPGRDFVHVSDVVQANLLALERDVPPGTCINVGTGAEIPVGRVAALLARAAGFELETLDHGEFRVGDIRSCYADLTRARQLLGYVPVVGIDAGLREFAQWAAANGAVDLYDTAVAELKKANLFHIANAIGG